MSFTQVAAPQPSGPADLDRVEAEAAQFVAGGWVAEHVPGLVARLRAADAVVEEVRLHLANDQIPCGVCLDLVSKYDQAVSP